MFPRALSFRHLLSVVTLFSVLATTTLAFAVGRVQWESTALKERSTESWRIKLKIFLPRAPDMAHMPMKFEFKPTAYYERAMVDDQPEPLERTIPLQNRQALIESVDVGFMDPASGDIQKRTKFSFKVTRAHGYEAGEYLVTIRDGRTGRQIGRTTKVKFLGENKIIDRRSIVFSGEKKEKKGDDKKESENASDAVAGDDAASESSAPAESDPMSDPMEEEPMDQEPMSEEQAPNGPPPVEEKPGGCGCRLAGSHTASATAGLSALLLLGGLVWRRRQGSAS